MALIQSNANDETPNKPQTNPSAKEPQIPNKMELIKLPTDMIAFEHEKTFRDLGSGFYGDWDPIMSWVSW